jgi:hypothetical protein
MQRITYKHLQAAAERLNEATGSPLQGWGKDEHGNNRANVGNFHISCAYGGYALHRMHNESGGVQSFGGGHSPARDVYERIHAMLDGIRLVGLPLGQ